MSLQPSWAASPVGLRPASADQAATEAGEGASARLRVFAPEGDAQTKEAVGPRLRQRLLDQFETFRR